MRLEDNCHRNTTNLFLGALFYFVQNECT